MNVNGFWRFKDLPSLPSDATDDGWFVIFKTNDIIANRISVSVKLSDDGRLEEQVIKFWYSSDELYSPSPVVIYDGKTNTWLDARFKEFFIYKTFYKDSDSLERWLTTVADKVEDVYTNDYIENKINGLIKLSNETTHKTDTDLTTAINSLIEGYGTGPTKITTEAGMTSLLETAEVGSVYQYAGETTDTYENGAYYVVDETASEFTVSLFNNSAYTCNYGIDEEVAENSMEYGTITLEGVNEYVYLTTTEDGFEVMSTTDCTYTIDGKTMKVYPTSNSARIEFYLID